MPQLLSGATQPRRLRRTVSAAASCWVQRSLDQGSATFPRQPAPEGKPVRIQSPRSPQSPLGLSTAAAGPFHQFQGKAPAANIFRQYRVSLNGCFSLPAMSHKAVEPALPLCQPAQTFIISGEGAEAAKPAHLCASDQKAVSNFCPGAWLTKGSFARAFVVFAIAGSLLARSRAQTPDPSASPSSACFNAKIEKVEFPGINEADQKILRGLIAAHEGESLNRQQLRQSLRVLFATGRFADLRAECEPSSGGSVLLSFAGTPVFFVGKVTVEGAPGRPTESQIVNASKLQVGEPFTVQKIEAALVNIRRLMEDNQFYRSSITYSDQANPA